MHKHGPITNTFFSDECHFKKKKSVLEIRTKSAEQRVVGKRGSRHWGQICEQNGDQQV